MENRNFHTALVGGFRKKDVVNFLAEDKRQHEAELKDLQEQLEEATHQIANLMTERDAAQEIALELRQQQESLQEQLEEAKAEVVEQRQWTEQIRMQGEAEQAESQSRISELERDLETAVARNGQLETQLQQLRQTKSADSDLSEEAAAAVAKELAELRQQLQAEKQRAEALAAKVNRPQQPAEGMDQLWNLCGKMERTLQQMDRLLDGPYRMTCYPEPVENWQEDRREESACSYVPAEPMAEPFVSAAENATVKSLLQRIRGKR